MREEEISVFPFEDFSEPQPLPETPKKGRAKKKQKPLRNPPKVRDGYFSNVREGKALSLKDDPRPHAIGENAKRLQLLRVASPAERSQWTVERLAATTERLRQRYLAGDLSALSVIVASEDPNEPWIVQEPWFKAALLKVLKESLPAIPRQWEGPTTEAVIAADEAFAQGEEVYRAAKKALESSKNNQNSITIKANLSAEVDLPEKEIERFVFQLVGDDYSMEFIKALRLAIAEHSCRDFAVTWASLRTGRPKEATRRHFLSFPPSLRSRKEE